MKRLALSVLCLLLLVTATRPARAWTQAGAWSPPNSITIRLNTSSFPTGGPSSASLVAAFQRAVDTWNGAGANFEFVFAGTSTSSGLVQNGLNRAGWEPVAPISPNPPFYFNLVAEPWTAGPTLVECDIAFYGANEGGSVYWYAGTGWPSSTQVDFESAALLGLGFCTGLSYSSSSTSVMDGLTEPGTRQRSLGFDDVAGLTAIYGAACDDDDGDGYANGTDCIVLAGDCDDLDSSVYPGAPELCDGDDNDCDGQVDEGLDSDGDGWTACDGDCNDSNPAVNPGASEACDGLDTDCSGSVPSTETDSDGDSYAECEGDCADGDSNVFPGASELCDGLDNDCDGSTPADEADADGDSHRVCEGDCDDGDPAVNPAATEACNGLDDDCDGLLDPPGSLGEAEFFSDQDGDDFGAGGATSACETPAGWSSQSGDCDDADPAVNPDAAEVCNLIDDDCDAAIDEGFDLDDDAFTWCGGDCDDGTALVYPGAEEVCNAIDDDCDGEVDEGFDVDGDGWTTCAGDCDDNQFQAHPEHSEIPYDGIDNDCDGEDLVDVDGDGYAATAVDGGDDCNDRDASVHPGADEIPYDGIDQDCSGADLTDVDGDGFDGAEVGGSDCNDQDAAIHPGEWEPYDDVDNDCDGTIDEVHGCSISPGGAKGGAWMLVLSLAGLLWRRRGSQSLCGGRASQRLLSERPSSALGVSGCRLARGRLPSWTSPSREISADTASSESWVAAASERSTKPPCRAPSASRTRWPSSSSIRESLARARMYCTLSRTKRGSCPACGTRTLCSSGPSRRSRTRTSANCTPSCSSWSMA